MPIGPPPDPYRAELLVFGDETFLEPDGELQPGDLCLCDQTGRRVSVDSSDIAGVIVHPEVAAAIRRAAGGGE